MSWAFVGLFAMFFYVGEFGRYILFAGGWALVVLLGRRWTAQRRIQKRIPTWADFRRELTASGVSVLMYTLVACFTIWGMWSGVLGYRPQTEPLWLFLLLQCATAIGHDAYFYWTHRLLHLKPFFRRAHLTHHLSHTPTVWTGYSFSWMEGLVQGMFLPIWLLFVPMSDLGITVFFIHQLARNVTGHSGFELAWPGFSRSIFTRWISTATHHDMHHTRGNCHYGLWFTWWDKWMGTEHPDYHATFDKTAKPWFGRKPPADADEQQPGLSGQGVSA